VTSSALSPAQTTAALVVAAVRPSRPNSAVIRAAAELAAGCGADLLVMGMVEVFVSDWSDLPYTQSAVLESYESSLFMRCTELLAGTGVHWSVLVTSNNIVRTISELTARRRVVGLVLGSQRSGGRLTRLRRRLLGSLGSSVHGIHKLVIADLRCSTPTEFQA
jgi:K+-sensing histidine kinase KdpD